MTNENYTGVTTRTIATACSLAALESVCSMLFSNSQRLAEADGSLRNNLPTLHKQSRGKDWKLRIFLIHCLLLFLFS